MEQLYIHSDKSVTPTKKMELFNQINKLNKNNAVIEKADEGYSIIILYKKRNKYNE